MLGLVLRAMALGSDLWLDEITPIFDYLHASPWQIVISYLGSNNHLLNTLLEKLSVSVFGEREWAIRLPAMVFGTVTIPALYWVARQALDRQSSLAAALLLSVSYHHIFFSQNARGYSAYLLFSLVSSVLLVKGLTRDTGRVWAAYVAAMLLNFSSLLLAGFVFAGHIVVGGLAVLVIRRQGGYWLATLRRLLGVFSLTAFLGFQLYAAVLPQMYVYAKVVYRNAGSGFSPFSKELFAEIARGLGAGFGTGLLFGAVPFLALAAAGYVILLRQNWLLTLALTLPCILQAALLLAQGFSFSPRFFILALPLAVLVVVQCLSSGSEAVARALSRGGRFGWWCRTSAVALLCLVSAAALPRYYSVPKQPYRAALEFVEQARRPDGIVIVIHVAETGFRFYGQRAHIREGTDYFYARSADVVDAILAANPGRPSLLVTTFRRALRSDVPDLDKRIARDWRIEQEFPATIGDGEIAVWRERQ